MALLHTMCGVAGLSRKDRQLSGWTEFIFALGVLIFTAIPSPANSDTAPPTQEFEKPPVLTVAEALPGVPPKTALYTLGEHVTNDGYLNSYSVRCAYGAFRVRGNALLRERLNEIRALAELDEFGNSRVFLDAAQKSGIKLLMSPIDAVKKGYEIVTNPEKVGETLEDIPSGVAKIFDWTSDVVEYGVDSASGLFDDEDKSNRGKLKQEHEPERGTGEQALELVGRGYDRGEKLALRYSGYERNRTSWYEKFQVDPYTSNQLLREEIIRVASIETGVGLAFKFAPGIPGPSELNLLLRWNDNLERVAYFKDPIKIQTNQDKLFDEIKVSEQTVKRLGTNSVLTPSRRSLMHDLLEKLPGVSNRAAFVDIFSTAGSEEGALFYLEALKEVTEYNDHTPIDRFIFSGRIPGTLTKSGKIFVFLPVDYLAWTKSTARAVDQFASGLPPGKKIGDAEFRVRGKISKRCAKELALRGVEVTYSGGTVKQK